MQAHTICDNPFNSNGFPLVDHVTLSVLVRADEGGFCPGRMSDFIQKKTTRPEGIYDLRRPDLWVNQACCTLGASLILLEDLYASTIPQIQRIGVVTSPIMTLMSTIDTI